MKLTLVGCSHHETSLAVRERLSFTENQCEEALRRLSADFGAMEFVLLSTCNRVEIYAATENQEQQLGARSLGRFLAEYHGLAELDVERHLFTLTDRDALVHLFSVAASLDSLVIGETQVLHQVKAAYELACRTGTAGPAIHSIFQHASYTAKRVAAETEIHRRKTSIPSVAIGEIAKEFYERLDDKRCLVIGTGEMGEEAVRYLVDARAKNLRIINRSLEKAQFMAAQYRALAVPWTELNNELGFADLVVSVTGATLPIVTHEHFKRIRSQSQRGTCLILDLAVPRDFEPSIGDLPDVYLYSIDDLKQVCDRNLKLRKEEWPKGQSIVQEEVDRFLNQQGLRSDRSTIQSLKAQAEAIKQAELERLRSKLAPHSLSEDSYKEIEHSFHRLVNKLLHPPLESLRTEQSESRATLLAALKRLFQLQD